MVDSELAVGDVVGHRADVPKRQLLAVLEIQAGGNEVVRAEATARDLPPLPIRVEPLRWQGVDRIALSIRRRPGNVRVRSGGNASDERVSNSLILDVVDGPLASRARSCPSGGR